MQYVQSSGFVKSLRHLYKRGGSFRKAEERLQVVLGLVASGQPNPLERLKLTNHGETRIRKCRKYGLPGGCRLITVVDDDRCFLLYAGSHDECDQWLKTYRGWEPRKDHNGQLVCLHTSGDDLGSDTQVKGAAGDRDWFVGPLHRQLEEADIDALLAGVPRSLCRRIEALESTSEESEILQLGVIAASSLR